MRIIAGGITGCTIIVCIYQIIAILLSSRQLQPSLSRDSRSYSSYIVINIVVIRRLITPGASAG